MRWMSAVLAPLVALCLFASPAACRVGPKETPPLLAPIAETETHRIRIENVEQGAIEVSSDKGKTWQILGRVTAPATQNLMGYLASGYAQLGTVSATAVHGIRIRVGDLTSAYPPLINIVPAEFSQTPKNFGGHISGLSGIYTNIPTGTSIFRDLAPRAGDPVYLEGDGGAVAPLPLNYSPKTGDVLVVVCHTPNNPLTEVDFENRVNGAVTVVYADGRRSDVASVLKPVYGVGRFDGTSYTGVGAINTNHTGVITVSTAPVSTSPLFEGEGDERRGGFQIEPVFHNSQSDEAWADMIMVIGTPHKTFVPDLEGTPPLFHAYLDITWLPSDPDHSWRAQIRRGSSDWLPMPELLGSNPKALRGVTAIRLIRPLVPEAAWYAERIKDDTGAYEARELAMARAGKIPIKRGVVVIGASVTDSRTRYVAFYVNGQFRAVTNSSPFSFDWDTTAGPDGEYIVEARAEDENSQTLSSTRMRLLVDNQKRASAQ